MSAWSRARPWLLVPLGYMAGFGALFATVWARGAGLATGDAIAQSAPACYGPHAIWTAGFLLGYPLAADPTQLRFYPPSVLCPLPGALEALLATPYAIAGIGMTGFVRALTGSWLGAICAGIAYSLGGFEIAHAEHAMISTPAAWAPFVLWATTALRKNPRAPFAIAGGALAVAACVLGGQPQIPAFALTLAAAYALADAPARERARYAGACALAFAFGIVLAAVQLLPEIELAARSSRAEISRAFFTADALPAVQLPVRLAFPYLLGGAGGVLYPLSRGALGSFPELTNSSGLALLLAASLGAFARGVRLRWFWIGLALLGWALSTGDASHLTALTYHLPLYSLFREPGRHAFESSFALAVLAGFGAAALERRGVSAPRAACGIALTGALGFVAWRAFASGAVPDVAALAAFDGVPFAQHADPLRNPAIALPLAVWAACALAALLAATLRATASPARAFVALLALGSVAFAWGGYWNWAALPRTALDRPVLAADVAAALSPGGRLLAARGSDPVGLYPNLTLLWGVPSVSGYVALVPQNVQRLLGFTPQGGLRIDAFDVPSEAVLDLVGTRLISVPENFVESARPASDPFPPATLSAILGGDRATPLRSLDFAVAGVRADRLALLASSNAAGAAPGTVLGDVVVTGSGGRRVRPLRAGIELRAPGDERLARTDLALAPGETVTGVEIRLTDGAPRAALGIFGVALIDGKRGSAVALGPLSYLAAEPEHWRRRTLDGAALFENLRALPRAWIPRRVRSASDAAALAAMHGERGASAAFDGSDLAFVDAGAGLDGARGTVAVTQSVDGATALRADCATPCLAVTSDTWYPGWSATVDGSPAPVVRVDVALRGVRLTPGVHRISFVYAPLSLRLGALLSFLAAAGLALLTLARRAGPTG